MNTPLDTEVLELIQAELDGMNDAQASARLQALLADFPQGREHYREMERVHRALGTLDSQAPPDSLRAAVMRAVSPPEPAAVVARATRAPRRLAWPWLGHAVAFALGGLVASLLGALLAPRSDGPAIAAEDYLGTLAPRETATRVDDSRFSSQLSSGQFRLLDRHDLPVIEFEIDAGEPVEVDFECLRGCAGFQGFAHRSGMPSRVRSAERRLSFANYGPHSAVVFIGRVAEASGAALRVRVLANGAVLHEDTLEFPGDDAT